MPLGGSTGIAPGASLYDVRVLDDNGYGQLSDVVGFEALARWNHAERGAIGPLTERVLTSACRQLTLEITESMLMTRLARADGATDTGAVTTH